jgi:5-methylcytosine-specific restriction enzyme subunit McrC
MDAPLEVLELKEFEPREIPEADLPWAIAEQIHIRYGDQVSVELPSFKNGRRWRLTAQGWVGYLPLSAPWGIRLVPKTPIGNIVRMLEYAYGLESLRFYSEISACSSLEEFFSELATILAKRVLDRSRRGLYRTYVGQEEALPYLRGRMLVAERARRPWDVHVGCAFEEHTTEVEENQLLAWTLACVLRSGLCQRDAAASVRQAYRAVHPHAAPVPFDPADCLGRLYNRLNADYEPMHALCRFFLDCSAPAHRHGDHSSLPFAVNMAMLFERFVGEWLRRHLPPHLTLTLQEPVSVGAGAKVSFQIDLVLYDAASGCPLAVLDTKYKVPQLAASDDVAQVVAYAQLKGCRDAFLLYPIALSAPIDAPFRDVRVRTVGFRLGGDLDAGGLDMIRQLTA